MSNVTCCQFIMYKARMRMYCNEHAVCVIYATLLRQLKKSEFQRITILHLHWPKISPEHSEFYYYYFFLSVRLPYIHILTLGTSFETNNFICQDILEMARSSVDWSRFIKRKMKLWKELTRYHPIVAEKINA